MPVPRTQNNTPLSQLSELPYLSELNQVSPIDSGADGTELPLTKQGQSNSELAYLNSSPVASLQSGGEVVRSKWSNNTSLSLNQNKELPAIPTFGTFGTEGADDSVNRGDRSGIWKNKILSIFGKGKKSTSVLPAAPQQDGVRSITSVSPIPALPSTKLRPTTSDTHELPDFYKGKNGAASNHQIPKKLLRSSKSLPDLIIHSVKKENITSDSKFIDLVLSRTVGKGEPDVVSEFFYLVDNDYKAVIEYSPQMSHKKGFILVNFNKDNVNDFEFDLLKIKNKR